MSPREDTTGEPLGEILTVERLDSIGIGLMSERPPLTHELVAAELIPFVEWNWLRAAGRPLGRIGVGEQLDVLHAALRGKTEVWTSGRSAATGFIRVRRHHSDTEHSQWIWFQRQFELSLRRGGFDVAFAKQVTGALGELEDNVHWHSELPKSGLVTFLRNDKWFEFVVLDRGIGALASLQKAEEFRTLSDEGAALEVAVGDGNSRFGQAARRGYGFHDLFLGLANRNALIRFRSGDHVLQLNGLYGQSMKAMCAQRARGNGFMIAVRLKYS